jgi:hypothetical protein
MRGGTGGGERGAGEAQTLRNARLSMRIVRSDTITEVTKV